MHSLDHSRRVVEQSLLRLKWLAAAANFELAMRRHARGLKANFNPNQPRVPRGNPEGGQWTDAGGGGGGLGSKPTSGGINDRRVLSDVTPDNTWKPGAQYAQDETGRLKLPDIPKKRPPTAQLRNRVAKEIAKAAAKQTLGLGGTLLNILEAASWLYEAYPHIVAYTDPPKSLGELQQAVSTPQKGYDIHHVVEQTAAEEDGFARSIIDGPENLVRIPTLKHWEITGWYQTKNKEFGGLSPRDYLRDKDWAERTKIGRRSLRDHGVLKP